jgi:branched-subunit amino acid ABC-type transport system permease component
MIRAAAYDREMLAAVGADVGRLYMLVFMGGSFLAGLGGALVTPVRSIVPGMDVEIIVEAFIVVVIGGLGSFWGTFLGALIFGQVLAFGILVLPGFSIFCRVRADGDRVDCAPCRSARASASMKSVTPVREGQWRRIPWPLLLWILVLCVPWLGSRFYTFSRDRDR